jgi:AAA15 family ATPase/GTPase
MIDKITIKNFKKFDEITFELGNPIVLIGPNNSGKTSLLQAITLWETGLRKWAALNRVKPKDAKRPGISINRKDLLSIPIPSAKLLWNKKNVRSITKENGSQKTSNINIEIFAEGHWKGQPWLSAYEFDYANDESFYCRPLRKDPKGESRFDINPVTFNLRVAYLQPMSGLASVEDRLTPGSIDRKIGEGKTADVIRNICYQLLHPERAIDAPEQSEIEARWKEINNTLLTKFGIKINRPVYNPENGLLDMTYEEKGNQYDLSSSGRGFQQTLLLLCFLYSNPNKIILMDEPDAHLEVLRQKEIYNLISDITRQLNSQLIIASHSEVVLDEAASSDDKVVAIIEQQAIQLNDARMQKEAKKMLTNIGWHKYYLAKLRKHCIFLEGTTDERNLIAYAAKLNHPVKVLLEEAFIEVIEGNIPGEAYNRFQSLRMVEPEIKGLAIFDKLDKLIDSAAPLKVLQWDMRELENYFCIPVVFMRWAQSQAQELFTSNYPDIMNEVIKDLYPPLYLNNLNNDWWKTEKMSDWAERVFAEFFKRLKQPVSMRKGNYHELISFLKQEEVHPEIKEKLDAIYDVIKTEQKM